VNKFHSMFLASIFSFSGFACESELVSVTHHDVTAEEMEQWMKQGILMCNTAQVEDLRNPMWSPKTNGPINPAFNNVTVTVFDHAHYYAISIGYEVPYPDAPHVLCHLSKSSQTLLYAEYFSEEVGNLEPSRKQYSEYRLLQQNQVRQIDTWSFSLSEIIGSDQD